MVLNSCIIFESVNIVNSVILKNILAYFYYNKILGSHVKSVH